MSIFCLHLYKSFPFMNQQNRHLRVVCKVNLYTDNKIASILVDTDKNSTTKKGFYKSFIASTPTEKKHNRASLSFNQDYEETRSGGVYTQSVQFSYPSNTDEHALESEFLKKVKLIGLLLSDGSEIIIGRNDVKQNRKPKLSFSSNLNFTEAKFVSRSIIPASIKNVVNTGYTFTYPFIYT